MRVDEERVKQLEGMAIGGSIKSYECPDIAEALRDYLELREKVEGAPRIEVLLGVVHGEQSNYVAGAPFVKQAPGTYRLLKEEE